MSGKTIIGISFLILAFVSADYVVVLAGIALVLGVGFTGWGMYEDGVFKC